MVKNDFLYMYKVYNPKGPVSSSIKPSGSAPIVSGATGKVSPESGGGSSSVVTDTSSSGLAAAGYAGKVAPEPVPTSKGGQVFGESSNPLSSKYVGDVSPGSVAYAARQAEAARQEVIAKQQAVTQRALAQAPNVPKYVEKVTPASPMVKVQEFFNPLKSMQKAAEKERQQYKEFREASAAQSLYNIDQPSELVSKKGTLEISGQPTTVTGKTEKIFTTATEYGLVKQKEFAEAEPFSFGKPSFEKAVPLIATAATGLALGFYGGGYSLATHPVASTTAMFKPSTYKQLWGSFKESPLLVTSQVGGMALLAKTISVGAEPIVSRVSPYVPKVAIRTLEIPQEGEAISIKILGIETKGGRALMIGTKTPEGIKVGRPFIGKYLEKIPTTTEIKIGSALETSTLQKNILSMEGVTPRAKALVPLTQKILRSTGKTKSAFITKELLAAPTERLPTSGVKAVLDIAKEEQGVVFGSKARAPQLSPKYEYGGEPYKLVKVPKDIEVRFDLAGEAKLGEITTKTVSRLKELGKVEEGGKVYDLRTAREIKDTPYAIEAKVGGKYEKVIEYKGSEQVIEGEAVPEWVVGIQKTGTPMKMEGIKITKLSEETRGVAQGVLRLRNIEEGGRTVLDIYPSPKRIKDIGSFSVSARTLQMSKVLPSRLKSNIEAWESHFPAKLVRSQVAKVLKEPTILADFRKVEPVRAGGYAAVSYVRSPLGVVPRVKLVEVSPVVSPKVSKSPLSLSVSPKSISPRSVSPKSLSSKSISPKSVIPKSLSVSVSPSVSKSFSPSPSVSPYPLISPSVSPRPSPSTSPLPSPSPSPSTYPSPSFSPYTTKKKIPPFPPVQSSETFKPRKTQVKKGVTGYQTFVRRFGKFKVLSGISTRAEAIRRGESVARSTLAATFKIKPVATLVSGTETEYIPSRAFRGYRIVKGTKIATPNQFIQRSKFRLSSSQERRDIQAARQQKVLKSKSNLWGLR